MTAILDFDRRITQRYSEFCAQHGEFYGGTFHCDEFGEQWVVEVAAFGVDDVGTAESLFADVQLPSDVQRIVDECKSMQNREAPRYCVWMVPQEAAREAISGDGRWVLVEREFASLAAYEADDANFHAGEEFMARWREMESLADEMRVELWQRPVAKPA